MNLKFIKVLIILLGVWLAHAEAGLMTCTYNSTGEVGKTYDLKLANITLSENIPDYTIIYSYNQIMVGLSGTGGCSSSGAPPWGTFVTLTDLPSSKPPLNYNGYTIYPTSVEGIGMSINNWQNNMNPNLPIPVYPSIMKTTDNGTNFWGGWVYIKLWKIPGNIQGSGMISFTGPTYHQGWVLTRAGDSFVNTDMSYSPPGSTNFWTISSRQLIGNMILSRGTCEMVGGDKTVQMGSYAFGENNQEYSAWKDASFSLKCPNAYGYGGSATASNFADYNTYQIPAGSTLAANSVRNANLTVTVVPRTEILTSTAMGTPIGGTVALDGTGAKGYGVQLAWGNYATLGATPAKPVVFNTPVLASTLNSAYASGAYALGTAMPGTVIQMGARYIRTNRDSGPGEANTSVEIIANYN